MPEINENNKFTPEKMNKLRVLLNSLDKHIYF